ncbi:MAG: PorT family protein [Bacteroidetes bacterium]|nr:PorT family protein [Bacteroidota bacterium]
MKIFGFIISFVAVFGFVDAQRVVVGVNGTLLNSWIINRNILEEAEDQEYLPSLAWNYGVSVAMFPKKRLGLEIDLLYGNHVQRFSGRDPYDAIEYYSSISYQKIDVPVMLKLVTEGGAFFEFGAVYSSITNPVYEREGFIEFNMNAVDTVDFTNRNYEVLLGLGTHIKLAKRLHLSTALRFTWGLSDLKGTDALGVNIENSYVYLQDHATHSAAAGLSLGLVYTFGKPFH